MNWTHAAIAIALSHVITAVFVWWLARKTAHWQLLALLLLAAPAWGHDAPPTKATETVDTVEVNSLYDEQGRKTFDQVIWWDWNAPTETYRVRAWRLVKDGKPWAERDWENGGWVCTWMDGDKLRCVRARSLMRTFTQYDPELIDRDWHPKENRKELLELTK